jgi:hypothetical protein
LGIEFSRTTARRFIILAGAISQLLGRLSRTIDAFLGRIDNVAAKFLACLWGEQKCKYRANSATNQKIR